MCFKWNKCCKLAVLHDTWYCEFNYNSTHKFRKHVSKLTHAAIWRSVSQWICSHSLYCNFKWVCVYYFYFTKFVFFIFFFQRSHNRHHHYRWRWVLSDHKKKRKLWATMQRLSMAETLRRKDKRRRRGWTVVGHELR